MTSDYSGAREPFFQPGPRPALEAILLVGGQGTRLRPLTVDRPKQMVPCAGVPFLAHQLAHAAASGITRVIMATCFKADQFVEEFGDGSRLGLELAYVEEEVPLDTGGAIRNVASQLRMHEKAEAAVTLHLVEVPDPARFGCVPTDAEGRVTAFLEKTPHPVANRINAGCYVFRRRFIDQIPAGVRVSVERQ